MAKAKINPEYNLPLIAERAGQNDPDKIFYMRGELHVEGVTQKALDDALAAYDHAADAPVPEPDELEVIKEALIGKGYITKADIDAKRQKMKSK